MAQDGKPMLLSKFLGFYKNMRYSFKKVIKLVRKVIWKRLTFILGYCPSITLKVSHFQLSFYLKRIIFSDLAKNVKIFNDDDKIKFCPTQQTSCDLNSFPIWPHI